MPFLPIFVFDGPKRPKIKRGKTIGGGQHWMVNSLRTVLDAFGFECRTAPGEAEAELAYLNRTGVIDAVLSDDVDCFLFGARTVIRNSSSTLSGNKKHGAKNSEGKDDGQHVNIYRLEDLKSNGSVNLTEGGLILIALLRGGDYDQTGIDGCGINTAHALARAGFGDDLLEAARSPNPSTLVTFLPTWRQALRHELSTNASGFAQRKSPTLAKRIGEDFPPLDVLKCYTNPITSESEGLGVRGLDFLWKKPLDIAKVAHVCELFFEWGVEHKVVKRFRSFLWPGAVLRTLLQISLEKDARDVASSSNVETPSKALARSLGHLGLSEDGASEEEEDIFRLIKTIHSERRHASTDHILEYRLEIDPREFVIQARSGIQGTRAEMDDSAAAGFGSDGEDEDEEDGKKKRGAKKAPPDPDSTLRVWMPAAMVEYAYPGLVAAFVRRRAAKEEKKGKRGTPKKRGKKAAVEEEEESEDTPLKSPPRAKSRAKATNTSKSAKPSGTENNDEKVLFKPKGKNKTTTTATKHSSHQPPVKSKTQTLFETLDNDSIIVEITTAKKSKVYSFATPDSPPAETPLVPRPFPITTDDDSPFRAAPAKTQNRRRIRASSSSSTDENHMSRLKKPPRKSSEHYSPRKAPPRAPSPSPMRPRLGGNIRPLQLATTRAQSQPPKHDDVIVISSDTDEDIPPMMMRSKALSKPASEKRANTSTYHNSDSDVIILS